VDLVLVLPDNHLWAIEIKRGLAPKIDRGFHHACADLEPDRCFVIYSGTERFRLSDGIEAISLLDLAQDLTGYGDHPNRR